MRDMSSFFAVQAVIKNEKRGKTPLGSWVSPSRFSEDGGHTR
jgi:hypothetical protein